MSARSTQTRPGGHAPYRSIASLQRDLATCRRCRDAGYAIESPPVVQGAAGRRAYLYGQAPGIVEGSAGAPWQGRAGRLLRRWLELDELTFDATFYCASVTRCYPGRVSNRGDRTPTAEERHLCASWRTEELRLLRPALIVTVGGLAARAIVGATDARRLRRQELPRRRRDRDSPPAPLRCELVAERRSNRRRLGKALAHARREIGRLDDPR